LPSKMCRDETYYKQRRKKEKGKGAKERTGTNEKQGALNAVFNDFGGAGNSSGQGGGETGG